MTKEEIARAKELDLLTYFKLVEPGNLKLVGKDYNDTLVQYMQEYRAHCISMDDILEETR